MDLYVFSRQVLASWVRTVCVECIARTSEVGIRNASHVRVRSVGRVFPVCAGVRFVQDRLTGA